MVSGSSTSLKHSGALLMARFDISGVDGLLAGLEDMAEQVPQLRDDILRAEADVIEPALRKSIADSRLVRTGALQRSIGRRNVKYGGFPAVRIGPQGEHHRYMPRTPRPGKAGIVTAGYVGYVGEYGIKSRGIRGREWLKKGLEKSKSAAFDAADAVYDEYMKKNNL